MASVERLQPTRLHARGRRLEDRERPLSARLTQSVLGLLLLVTVFASAASAEGLESGRSALARGDYPEALKLLEAAHAAKTPGADLVLVGAYLETGRYDALKPVALAVAASEKRGSDRWAAAETALGRVEAETGDYKAAIKRLKDVVKHSRRFLEARIVLSEVLYLTGTSRDKLTEADQIADFYQEGEVKGARDLAWLGRALTLTEYYQNANEVFGEAVEADPSDLVAHQYWAELFLRAGKNEREADVSVREILKRNAYHPAALVLAGSMDMSSDSDASAATDRVERALAVNPRFLPAHHLRARILIDTEQVEAAVAALTEALAVNPKHPMTHTLIGAARLLLEDNAGFEASMKAAMATNPRYAEGWATVAEIIERRHRYPEALEFHRKAIKLDKEYWPAWVGLGMGLSRAGQDDEAAKILEQAFDGDSFNVHAYNMTEYFYDGTAKRMEWVDATPFRLRLERDQAAILAPLVKPLLKDAWDRYRKQYDYEPTKPLHVEYFSDRKIFAVRTVGSPGLAAHGVCFGHVVTAASPSNADNNWPMVLWHELAHIWHHQMSRGRVPRWFTEGLAELETTRLKTYWKRELDNALWLGLSGGSLKGIAEFNTMFTHAKSIEGIILAYYYATQVVRYIESKWGYAVLPKMLSAWGDRKSTAVVFETILGTDLKAFDRDLVAWLRSTWLKRYVGSFAPNELPPGDPAGEALGKAQADVRAQKWPEAKEAVASIFAAGHDSADLRELAARIAHAVQDWDAVIEHTRKGLERDPQRVDFHGLLVDAYGAKSDDAGLYQALTELAEITEDDVALMLRIAEMARRNKDAPGQTEYARRALEVAPFVRSVRVAVARAHLASGRADDALRECEVGLSLPDEAGDAEVLAVKADALEALGRVDDAKALRARAPKPEPVDL